MLPLNSKGFSLLQAIVTTLILGIIALTMAQLMSDFQKHSQDTRRNLEFDSILTEIDLSIASSNSCANLFSDLKIDVPLGVDSASSNRFEKTLSFLKNNGSIIGEIGITKNGLEPLYFGFPTFYKSFQATNLPIRYYIADFKVVFEKKGPSYGSSQKQKTFFLYLKVNNNLDIEGCGLAKETPEGQCILQGRTYNSLRFPACN